MFAGSQNDRNRDSKPLQGFGTMFAACRRRACTLASPARVLRRVLRCPFAAACLPLPPSPSPSPSPSPPRVLRRVLRCLLSFARPVPCPVILLALAGRATAAGSYGTASALGGRGGAGRGGSKGRQAAAKAQLRHGFGTGWEAREQARRRQAANIVPKPCRGLLSRFRSFWLPANIVPTGFPQISCRKYILFSLQKVPFP